MEILIDSADVKAIAAIQQIACIDGVTTNPTILSRTQQNYQHVLQELIKILRPEQTLHIQVVSTEVDAMIQEARRINQLRPNTFAKIPCTKNGYEVMKRIKEEGGLVTATACYSISQGLMAAKAGVDYIAPYLNRLDNIGADGCRLVGDLVQILKQYNYQTKVVAASFKNTQQVIEMMKAQCPAVTVPLDVFEKMMSQSMSDEAVATFTKDWENMYQSHEFKWQ